MKKLYLLFLFLLCFFLQSCTDSSMNYTCELYDDKIEIGYNTSNSDAFIGGVFWDFDLEDTMIIIPDSYNGCNVTTFGGYSGIGNPTPFALNILTENYESYHSSLDENQLLVCEEVIINVKLNRFLEKVELAYFDVDGYYLLEGVYYKITLYFDNNEYNEFIYAEDGLLYYKNTNELVN